MGLLAPLFLAGVVAIALPLWLHRLQAQSSDREPFGSTMFLQETEQQVHVQKKLKFLLLLALRIALITLLVVAFAKPFLRLAPLADSDQAAGSSLVVVDTSVSMGRAGVFDQAASAARAAIDSVENGINLQVLSADARVSVVTDLQPEKSTHRAAISRLEPGNLRLNYGEMMAALDQMASTLLQPVTVHLVSDYQASSMPVRFADLIAPNIAEFVAHRVGTGSPVNWTIEFIRELADEIEIGVNAHGERERVADLELLLDESVIATQGLTGLGSHTFRFEMPELVSGDNRLTARIVADDDLQADNERYHVIENAPPGEVPLITFDPAGLPATYISAALESAGSNDYSVQSLVVGTFDLRVLSRYRWLVIDDIGSVDAALADALNDFLGAGGNILAFAGDRAASLESIPLTGHQHESGSIVDYAATNSADRFLGVGQIDTGHASLARSSGWHDVNFSRSMPVTLLDNDQVLMRLENNEPFLLEHRVGQGRLLLMLGGLDNRWNDLPIRPVFVSFVIEAARYLSGINQVPRTYSAGARLPLVLTGSASGQVVDPDGNTVLSLADTTREQQINLDQPGFYEVYTPEGNTLVAVNVDVLESDPEQLPVDLVDRWRQAIGSQSPSATMSVQDSSVGSSASPRQLELWHWILLIATLALVAESVLGNRYLQPRRLESG